MPKPVSRRGTIRRALRTSTLEGILAEGVTACAGGGVLVAWALALQAPGPIVAALAALPALAQVLQVPAARLTARLSARKAAIAGALARAQVYAVLAALPFLPVGRTAKLAVLVLAAGTAAGLGALAQHAWLTWTAALFRSPIRGRVLARRAGRVTLAGSLAALAVAALLDRSAHAARPALLAALAGVAWLSGVFSALVLARQHAPLPARRPRPERLRVREALAAAPVRRGLRYVLAWNAAVGLTASAGVLFMLHHLRLGAVALALHGLAIAASAAAAAPLWARLLHRAGPGRVLVISAAGAALLPFLWLAASERVLWPVMADAILGGVLLGGHGVAAAHLPVALAPRGRRAEVLAGFSAAGGVAFAVASLSGGLLAAHLPFAIFVGEGAFVAKKLVFAAGGAARLGAAALGAAVFRDDVGG
jgi:hypothetical protein